VKKYSRQREFIYSSLQERTDHPTAEALYIDLKEKMPEIGIATVYRNLSELCEQGKIIKIKSKLGSDRFDGNIVPHIHFQCKKCKKILDIFLNTKEMNRFDNDISAIAEKIGGKAVSNEILITGTCETCIKISQKTKF